MGHSNKAAEAASDLFAGLMSGTSLDGIDAVLLGMGLQGPRTLAAYHLAFPEEIRHEALALHEPCDNELDRVALLGNRLAQLYADAIHGLLAEAGAPATSVCAIGCHGQTIRHRPESGYTLQINNPALLAERTGLTVVADFRSRDIAAGGQGAPLVPAFHDALFRISDRHRVILNLGGIANVTNLAPGHPTTGFDCGPANMLLDAWAARHLGRPFDENGDWAQSGTELPALLNRMLSDVFFAAVPPKSCGREQFNLTWLDGHLEGNEKPADVQATLLALTANSAARAIRLWCGQPDEIYVCGGGAHNGALLRRLEQALPGTELATTEQLGISPLLVEASAFAWLAYRTLRRLPGNLPAVTGARGPRVLGAIYPA